MSEAVIAIGVVLETMLITKLWCELKFELIFSNAMGTRFDAICRVYNGTTIFGWYMRASRGPHSPTLVQ